jgi:hypothetical protein
MKHLDKEMSKNIILNGAKEIDKLVIGSPPY